ncbi:unnamed protein product [Pedinophyceae sp. YPF-701]|nr:unnamed protein product [Pedinophyceae sp. YPF-701]
MHPGALELLAFVVIFAYIFNFFVGRKQNERIAASFAQAFLPDGALLDREFAQLQPDDMRPGEVILKDSNHFFRFYLTGRRGPVACCNVRLQLSPRADLLARVLAVAFAQFAGLEWLAPRDTCVVELELDGPGVPGFVMAVAASRAGAADLKSRHNDLRRFAREMGPEPGRPWLDSSLYVLCEHRDPVVDVAGLPCVQEVLGPVAGDGGAGSSGYALLAEGLFDSLLLSPHYGLQTDKEDRPPGAAEQRGIMRLTMRLPPGSGVQGRVRVLEPLMEMALALADALPAYRPTERAKKRRKEVEEDLAAPEREREEEARRKRAEDRAAEKRREAARKRSAKAAPERLTKEERAAKKAEKRRNNRWAAGR